VVSSATGGALIVWDRCNPAVFHWYSGLLGQIILASQVFGLVSEFQLAQVKFMPLF
jgi:hypothetical protein